MTNNKITVFATRNSGKLREVQNLFLSYGISLIGLEHFPEIGEIEETGNSFEDNAILKAKTVFNLLRMPVLADDSGLSVQQLDGRPGVHSARYAGEQANDQLNNAKLINELQTFPAPHPAKYVCCAVYYDGATPAVSIGEAHGQIIIEPRGSGGFGYDPYFVPEGYDCTMAELPLDEKNKISHRGKAFLALQEMLCFAKE
jgi:XTP/dITP diphosphohydrolase